jgi:vancomycin resistance protein YoaR
MRRILIGTAIAIPVLTVLVIAGTFAYDEWINDEQVGRNVSAAGVELSGMSQEEATAAVAEYEAQLAAEPATFSVDGDQVTLAGAMVGLEIDEDTVAAAAHAARRQSGLLTDFTGWVRSWWTPVDLTVTVTMDESQLEAILDEWDRNVIDEPAYEGAVVVVNGVPGPEYPQPGQMIDRPQAIPLILTSLESRPRELVILPLTDLTPVINDADVDAAVEVATELVSGPVVLSLEGFEGKLVFPPATLAAALTSEPVVHSPAELVVSLDAEALLEGTEGRFDEFMTEPVDATFIFDEETKEFTTVASQSAIVVDVDALAEAVETAALGIGRGRIPTMVGDEAAFTTEMAEAMGPITEVSTFTTFHPCCANRVINIQKLADEIDGAIVMPGETFSVNDRAGQRTLAEGYVRAGAIIQGAVECCDNPANIGGGTSQFGTTFYNAVFFSCYEDVEHQPHSLYFPRYPFVREATMGFPKPDVIFRNDSDTIVYIDTSYTGGSITVTFYGNNGGRECIAERNGNTVTRIMTHPDGSVTRQEWTWFYRKPKPPTTTTTEPPDTTTTTVPEPPPDPDPPPDTTTTTSTTIAEPPPDT